MALLGWVPGAGAAGSGPSLPGDQQPRFLHNESGRCVPTMCHLHSRPGQEHRGPCMCRASCCNIPPVVAAPSVEGLGAI